MEFKELEGRIQEWAKVRGIVSADNVQAQALKCVEEVGETVGAILKGKRPEIIDGIGDIMVTLIILCQDLDLDLTSCLEEAYDEIKGREGRLENGVFIKND